MADQPERILEPHEYTIRGGHVSMLDRKPDYYIRGIERGLYFKDGPPPELMGIPETPKAQSPDGRKLDIIASGVGFIVAAIILGTLGLEYGSLVCVAVALYYYFRKKP